MVPTSDGQVMAALIPIPIAITVFDSDSSYLLVTFPKFPNLEPQSTDHGLIPIPIPIPPMILFIDSNFDSGIGTVPPLVLRAPPPPPQNPQKESKGKEKGKN